MSKYEDWLTPENKIRLTAWARDGLSDEQIAHNMGISPRTLYLWKRKHEDFAFELKHAKDIADYAVENALYKRAMGYDYTVTTVKKMADGKEYTQTQTIHVPPDVKAMTYWLKNRRPDKWKDNPTYDTTEDQLRNLRTLLKVIPSSF